MSRTASAGLRYFSWNIQTVEQAEQAIKDVAYVLYTIAALRAVLGFFIYPRVAPWTFDVAFAVVMGFILQKSKSRCVALVVAAYATLIILVTVATALGLFEGGGKNVVLAVIVAYTACRGVYATVLYHRWRNTKPNRRNVVILAVIAVVLTVVVVFAGVVVFVVLGYDLGRDADAEDVGVALMFAVWIVGLLVFNRLLPFTRRLQVVKAKEAAAPVSPVGK